MYVYVRIHPYIHVFIYLLNTYLAITVVSTTVKSIMPTTITTPSVILNTAIFSMPTAVTSISSSTAVTSISSSTPMLSMLC